MASPPRQLALALDHAESYAREDFLSGPCNEGALQLLDCWPDWPASAIAVVGPEGSGKTHLAMMWATVAGARIVSARALDEAALPSALATGALVVEDAAMATDERTLFHLINLAREEKAFLLFTARTAPTAWPFAIPDLVSRLRALPVVALQAPDDAMLRAVIVKLATDRQLMLDESGGALHCNPYRAFLRGRPRRRARARQRSATPRAPGDPRARGGRASRRV